MKKLESTSPTDKTPSGSDEDSDVDVDIGDVSSLRVGDGDDCKMVNQLCSLRRFLIVC